MTPLRIQTQMRLKNRQGREISERRQVGDTESMVHLPPKPHHSRSDSEL